MINLSSRAEPRNSEVSCTFTVASTAAHDRAWWAGEAASAGTDWSRVVETALELMVVAGIIEQPEPEVLSSSDAPSWREAGVEYRRGRAGRLAVEIEPKRLAWLRRLMTDSISLERAYYDINRSNATPAVTLDAIKLSVRERGIKALDEPLNQERTRRCDPAARAQLDRWLADFRTEK